MEGVWHVLEVKTPLLPSQGVQLKKGRAREFSLRSPCKQLTVVHRPSLKGEPYGVECMHERVSGHFSEYRDISDFFRGSRLVRIRVGGGSHGYGTGRCTVIVSKHHRAPRTHHELYIQKLWTQSSFISSSSLHSALSSSSRSSPCSL